MRWTGRLAVTAAALVITTAVAQAAEWPRLPGAAVEGATVWDPGPRWPEVPAAVLAAKPASAAPAPRGTAAPAQAEARTDAGAPVQNEAQLPARAQASAAGAAGSDDITGAIGESQFPAAPVVADEPLLGGRWPAVPPPAPLRSFVFEGSVRYWYSSGTTQFGFTNGDPLFGDPTSTLDWQNTRGNAGELFARVDHRPTGLFVKGIIGAGKLGGGTFIDRDFFTGQLEFSDTSSEIKGDTLFYGLVDLGWALHVPKAGVRVGAFAGYHYWREKKTAYGLTCNSDDVGGLLCGPPGTVLYPTSTAVLIYEPTWQALRIGLDGRYQITPNWSVAGEAAFVPLAWLENKDSHLLRQSFADLGPAPNVIARSRKGYGVEAELFVNYAFTPNFEIGIGGRYWGLSADGGTVVSGPYFSPPYELTLFDHNRFGLLIQATGRF